MTRGHTTYHTVASLLLYGPRINKTRYKEKYPMSIKYFYTKVWCVGVLVRAVFFFESLTLHHTKTKTCCSLDSRHLASRHTTKSFSFCLHHFASSFILPSSSHFSHLYLLTHFLRKCNIFLNKEKMQY
jgi:hypothetical protein